MVVIYVSTLDTELTEGSHEGHVKIRSVVAKELGGQELWMNES